MGNSASQPSVMPGATALGLPLPSSAAEVERIAAARGLAVGDTCMPGVVANLVLLDRHARIMLDGDGDATP